MGAMEVNGQLDGTRVAVLSFDGFDIEFFQWNVVLPELFACVIHLVKMVMGFEIVDESG